jgi:hypothetical protein
MTQKDIEVLHIELAAAIRHLETIEALQRETNGRIRDLELWRAKMQGVASTSRILWLIAGASITALFIRIIQEFPWGQ